MKNEGKHTGEYQVSESNGTRSKDTGTVLSGQALVAGELIAKETASGKIVAYDPTDTIAGSNTVVGISYDNNDATAGDIANAVYTARDAEVRGSDLTYNEAVEGVVTVEVEALRALDIIVR